MTTLPHHGVPQWTRGDRLRKARSLTGMTTREFAGTIGVSQKTITDAEGDKRTEVRKILLNAWAMATGVSVDWLRDGTAPSNPDGSPGAVEALPRLDSNQQPSGYENAGRFGRLTVAA